MAMEINPSAPLIAKNVPLTQTVGASGIWNFSGILQGYDYNVEFTGAKFFDNVDRMLSDPACWGAYAFARLPILAADWQIEPGDNDEANAWAEECLFHRMNPGFYEWLDQCLDYLPYGHMVFEKLWQFDKTEKKWYWDSWSQRLPKTILYWDNDNEEHLQQIRQWAFKGMSYGEWHIPASKIIVFTNTKRGANYRGRSIFRSAFKPYDLKSKFEVIQAMAAERHGLGIPAFQVPADATPDEKAGALEILEHLHASDSVGVIYHEGWKFELFGVQGKPIDLLPSIKHFATEIASQVLAQWSMLGEAEHGSKATATVQVDPYFLGLTAVSKYIEGVLNPVIAEMTNMNFSGVNQPPRVKCGKMQPSNAEVLATAFQLFAQAGYTFDDPAAIQSIRDVLGLTEMTDEDIEAIRQKINQPKPATVPTQALPFEPTQDSQARTPIQLAAPARTVGDPLTPWRQPAGAEMHVALADIADGHQNSSEQLRSTLENGEKPIVDELTEAAKVALKAKDVSNLKNIPLQKQKNLQGRIKNIFIANYQRGRRDVASELARQKNGQSINPLISARQQGQRVFAEPPNIDSIDPEDWDYLNTEADTLASAEANKLRTAALSLINGMIARGVTDPGQIHDALMQSISAGLAGVAADNGSAGYGMGRHFEANQNSDDISKATRTGILDSNICGNCADGDGDEYDSPDAADSSEPLPDPNCDGGAGRCRCMYVYTLATEAPTAEGAYS